MDTEPVRNRRSVERGNFLRVVQVKEKEECAGILHFGVRKELFYSVFLRQKIQKKFKYGVQGEGEVKLKQF